MISPVVHLPTPAILFDLVNQIALECDLEESTISQYRRALKRFGVFLGHEATVEDLTIDAVNGFMVALKRQGLTGTTIRNYRVSITRVWNHAIENGLAAPYDHRRLRSPKIIQRPVRSWTLSQVLMLTGAARLLTGWTRIGIAQSDLLTAWINVGYDTGMRPIDLRMLRWCDIDMASGIISITQHKTSKPHTARLRPKSIEFLRAIEKPRRKLVFPIGKGGMRKMELLLFEQAVELGFVRVFGQGLGTLRKTHATVIYERDGESAAAESLGHVGGTRTVRASYIDSRSIRSGRLPPDIAS
jgi:integrase